MAAYKQAKWMQRGVVLGENQFSGSSSAVKFISNPIPIGTGDFTVEFYGTMYGSNSSYASLFNAVNPSVGGSKTFSFYNQFYPNNGIYGVLFSPDISGNNFGDQVSLTYRHGDDSKFLVSVTRQGTTVKAYINGELKATKEQSEVKDLGDLQLAIANSSDVGFVRVWNYALSADEIATLYNNGDPMGYVVPKTSRYFEMSYNSDFSSGVDGWKGTAGSIDLTVQSNSGVLELSGNYGTYQIIRSVGSAPKYATKYKIRIELEEPISVSSFKFFPFSTSASVSASFSEPTAVFEGVSNIWEVGLNRSCYLYIYGVTPNTVVRIKSILIEPVGILAEYLPQNLMESRKGPEVEPKAKIYVFNTGDEYYKSVISGVKYPFDCIYRVDYVVNEWDYQPKSYGSVGFLGISGATILTPYSQDWSTLEKAKVGEPRYLLIKMPGAGNPALYVYGGNDNDVATARHLKVTIKGVTPVSIPLSWLDSAKQLPLSDEYMEPLFQSIGGYDMAANGAPEILYNE